MRLVAYCGDMTAPGVLSASDLVLTGAASPRVEAVAHAGSTNAELIAAAGAEPDAWPHLSVLATRDQTAGRGRLDRQWVTPPGAAGHD